MDESAGQGLDSNFTGSAEGSNSSCYPGPGSLPASSTHALETNDEQPPAYELLDILPQDSGPSVTVPSEQTNASPWANTPLLPPRPTNLSLSPYPIQSAFASPSSPSMPPLHIESIPAILEFNLFRGLRRDVTVIAADRVTCLYFLDYAPPQWRTWCRSLRRWGPSGQLLYHIRKTENNFEFLPGDAMTQGFSMQRTPKLTITKVNF